jgi:guanyl-specific ribonuclease Sa
MRNSKMRLNKIIVTAAACAAATLAAAPAAAQMTDAGMRSMLASWPMSAQKAAADMMEKYGPPQEATATMLKWNNNGPWKYTIISNREIHAQLPCCPYGCDGAGHRLRRPGSQI